MPACVCILSHLKSVKDGGEMGYGVSSKSFHSYRLIKTGVLTLTQMVQHYITEVKYLM